MKRVSFLLNGWVWRVFLLGLSLVFTGIPRSAGQASIARLASQPGIAPGWQQSRPDTQLNFSNLSQHALRLSPISPNYPQIVYGGDHLYYSYQDAGGWHVDIVDNNWGVGSSAALALDSSGKAYISYYDMTNGDLKYATNRWGGWSIDIVASAGNVGRYSDIAIDHVGDPSIVYYNSTSYELHYINYDSGYGDWTEDEVVATGVHDYFSHPGWFSLAMDPTAYKPHVSYYDYTDSTHGSLEWAHYDNSSNWIHSSVEFSCVPGATTCKLGEYNSIALHPTTHQPAIAYSYYDAYSTATFWYSAYNGSTWVDDWDTPAASTPNSISLAFDVSGYPHVSWNDSSLKYSSRGSGGTWTGPTTLDASVTAGQPVSMDIIGILAKVAYYNPSNGVLYFKDHDRSSWKASTIVVTQGHDMGSCSSLSIDSLGSAHISYFDNTNKHLLYARSSGSTWTKNTIDSTGNAGCYSAMIANPLNNDPTVAYINSGNLYYVVGNGTTWVSPLPVESGVDSSFNGFQAFDMAIGSDGRPHMVYRKGGNIWYAVLNGTTWTKTQIVTGPTGSYVALALGPANQPHVAFYQSGSLKYTHYYLGAWQSAETIAATGMDGSGVGVDMAVNNNDLAFVAFLDAGGSDLSVSSRVCNPFCGWSTPALVDDDAEEYFSLAMDRSGNPHLATWALNGSHLHYLTRRNSTWSVLDADANAGTGWYPSISLAPNGTPRISYYDTYNDDLLYILKLDRLFLPLVIR
jgi:hypothetical protein